MSAYRRRPVVYGWDPADVEWITDASEEHQPTPPGFLVADLETSENAARASSATAPRTDLARPPEPSSHAGSRPVARSRRERSRGVCSARQQQSPGGALTPRGADKEA